MTSIIRIVACLAGICAAFSSPAVSWADPIDYHEVRGRFPRGSGNGQIEGESLRTGNGARIQDLRHYGKDWTGGHHLLWEGRIGQTYSSPLRVSTKGSVVHGCPSTGTTSM